MFNKNSRHQYDFLNPNDRKNLRLNAKKEWEEDVQPDHRQENKAHVIEMDKDIQSIKSEIQKQVQE